MDKCVACGSSTFNVLIDGLEHKYTKKNGVNTWNYELIECSSCGLGSISPRPSSDLVSTFYSSDYELYNFNPKYIPRINSLKYKLAKMKFAGILSKNNHDLSSLLKIGSATSTEYLTGRTFSFILGMPMQFPREAKILDLGFGSGAWLYNMAKLGYRHLSGCDIDANQSILDYLASAGVKISKGDFLKIDFPEAPFDIIRLEQVFEHLPDPIEILQRCRSLLKPGSFLLMTFPCFNSLCRNLSIVHWTGLQLPYHVFH